MRPWGESVEARSRALGRGWRAGALAVVVCAAGCAGSRAARSAWEFSGGQLDLLSAEARGAVVYVQVWLAGGDQPAPATAFVVGRRGRDVHLLTAWHVLHPEDGRHVVRMRLRGGGVDELDTHQPTNVEVGGSAQNDITLLRVKGDPNGPVLRVGGLEGALYGKDEALAIGFVVDTDSGELPAPAEHILSLSRTARPGREVLLTDREKLLPGMSGGPVLLRATGLVVGVVRGRIVTGPEQEEGLVAPVSTVAVLLRQEAGVELQPPPVLYRLPPLPVPLIDRPEEAKASEALDPGPGSAAAPFVLLTGGPGTGKTVLAAKVAWKGLYAGRYPGGVYFIEVKDRTPEQVVRDLAVAVFQQPPPAMPMEELAARVRTRLAGKRALVVLDDLRWEQLDPVVMSAVADTTVLATSRRRYNDSRLTAHVEVGTLPAEGARKLLTGTLRQLGRTEIDPDGIARICDRLGNHALAISLAGGAMAALGLDAEDFLERLESSRLDILVSDDSERSIRASFEVSWRGLEQPARAALVALAQGADAPLPPDVQRALVGAARWPKAVDRLVRVSLATRQGGTLQLHPLIREWAREKGDREATKERGAAGDRLSDWLVERAAKVHPGEVSPELALHLAEAQRQAHAQGRTQRVHELAARWDEALDRSGQWSVLVELWERAVQGLRPRGGVDLAGALHNLGVTQQRRGDYPTARQHYEKALGTFRELGDRANVAASLHQLGILAQLTGDYPTARQHYEESLRIKRELGDRAGIANSLHQLGILAQLTGDYPTARQHYEESLRIERELGNRAGIAISLGQLGRLAEKAGDLAGAAGHLREALDLFGELGGASAGHARVLWALARVARAQKRPPEAREYAQRAVDMLEKLGDPAAGEARRLWRELGGR